MVVINCQLDGSCPYQYYCNSSNQCIHNPVFPLYGYPIAIYCLFPFASAICNTSGNSFGQFKVLLLMDALDYTQSAATIICYPLILGTALYNYVSLIFRRHPQKPTSLVDYNIVMIIIPNVLYGSTIGALINNFMPPIAADCIITVLLVAFSIKFFLKFKNYKKQLQKTNQIQDVQVTPKTLQMQQFQTNKIKSSQPSIYPDDTSENSKEKQECLLDKQNKIYEQQKKQAKEKNQQKVEKMQSKQNASKEQTKMEKNSIQEQSGTINPYQQELDKKIKYETTRHVPHILATIGIFGVFQTCSFLAQGKIIYFSFCSIYYVIGIVCLTILYAGVLVGMFQYTKHTMSYFKKIGYQYEYPLGTIKYFSLVSFGSFLGGFNGGLFAIGNSTTIIFALLYLQVEPMVATASVGYQIIFSAAASLLQAISMNKIPLQVVGFFLLITLVGGGILSFIVQHFVKKLNKQRVNMILMAVIGSLTATSALSMVINIALGFVNFGETFMVSAGGSC